MTLKTRMQGTVVSRDEPLYIKMLVSIIFFSTRPMLQTDIWVFLSTTI